MGSFDQRSGAEEPETHRRLLQFLRGLSELDAALGRWRPDYGGLRAPQALIRPPRNPAHVTAAHRLYSEGLGFFADHPLLARALDEPARSDVDAAIADALNRFGAAVVPLEGLTAAAAAAGAMPSPPPPPPPPIGPAGAPIGSRVAESPWEAERREAASRDRADPGRRSAEAPGRRTPSSPEAPSQPVGKGFAVGMGLLALLIMAIVVAGVVLGARTLLGSGPTAAPGVPSAPPATLPASALPAGSPPDVLAPAADCSTIPSGQVPTGLAVTSVSSGIGSDPAVGYSNPYITAQLASTVRSGTSAFSLIAVVLPFEATAPPTSPPVDRAGTIQLLAYWNGAQWYGALRNWTGSSWTLVVGTGSGVNVAQNGTAVSLYWQGLAPGDKYGVILATGAGCSVQGMSSTLTPEQIYGTQATA